MQAVEAGHGIPKEPRHVICKWGHPTTRVSNSGNGRDGELYTYLWCGWQGGSDAAGVRRAVGWKGMAEVGDGLRWDEHVTACDVPKRFFDRREASDPLDTLRYVLLHLLPNQEAPRLSFVSGTQPRSEQSEARSILPVYSGRGPERGSERRCQGELGRVNWTKTYLSRSRHGA